jgi:hypothetical protein
MRNDHTYAYDPVPWVQVMLSGVSLGSSTPLTFVRLFAAIRRVHLFYRKKFDERGPSGSKDLIYDLPPQQLATLEEYSKGFRVYFGFIALIVLVLSLVRPENLRSPGLPITRVPVGRLQRSRRPEHKRRARPMTSTKFW